MATPFRARKLNNESWGSHRSSSLQDECLSSVVFSNTSVHRDHRIQLHVCQHHGMQQHKCAPTCTCTSTMVASNLCAPTHTCSNTHVHQDQYPKIRASAPQWPTHVPQHHGSPNYACISTTVANTYASIATPVSSGTCVCPKTTASNYIYVHTNAEQSSNRHVCTRMPFQQRTFWAHVWRPSALK